MADSKETMMPFNGDFYGSDGEIRNLDEIFSIAFNGSGYSMKRIEFWNEYVNAHDYIDLYLGNDVGRVLFISVEGYSYAHGGFSQIMPFMSSEHWYSTVCGIPASWGDTLYCENVLSHYYASRYLQMHFNDGWNYGGIDLYNITIFYEEA